MPDFCSISVKISCMIAKISSLGKSIDLTSLLCPFCDFFKQKFIFVCVSITSYVPTSFHKVSAQI